MAAAMAPAKLPLQGIRLSFCQWLSSCHFFLLCHWYPRCPGSFTNLSPSLPDQKNFTPGFCRSWNEEELNRLDDVNLKDDILVKLVLNTFMPVTVFDFRINLISFRTTGRVKTDNRFRPVSLRRFFPFPVTFSLIHVYSGKPSDWLLSTGLFQEQLSHIYLWLLYCPKKI